MYHSAVIVASDCFPSNEADSSLITADAVKRSMTGRARHSREVVKGAPTVLTLRRAENCSAHPTTIIQNTIIRWEPVVRQTNWLAHDARYAPMIQSQKCTLPILLAPINSASAMLSVCMPHRRMTCVTESLTPPQFLLGSFLLS